jgi:hypothetical protein
MSFRPPDRRTCLVFSQSRGDTSINMALPSKCSKTCIYIYWHANPPSAQHEDNIRDFHLWSKRFAAEALLHHPRFPSLVKAPSYCLSDQKSTNSRTHDLVVRESGSFPFLFSFSFFAIACDLVVGGRRKKLFYRAFTLMRSDPTASVLTSVSPTSCGGFAERAAKSLGLRTTSACKHSVHTEPWTNEINEPHMFSTKSVF